MPASMVLDYNQNSFKWKTDRIFNSRSNNGKREHSVALSQIMVKHFVISLFFVAMVVCGSVSKPFISPSEQAQPTVALLYYVPDLQPANLFVIPSFLSTAILKLLSKQHTPKTAPKDPTVAASTSLTRSKNPE